ncbi:MAG: outer membrane lipoprotein carrier protein LolA [Balneolaceae bacterium]
MNSIFRYKKTGIFLFALFYSLTAVLPSEAQTAHFDDLKSKFAKGEIFSADFRHQFNDAFTGEETVTEGKIWIGRDKYRIEADNQVMVVNGELSQVYDSTRNRLIISKYIEEEDDYAPSRMLQGVDESYTVHQQILNDDQVVITLITDDLFAIFNKVEIKLNSFGQPSMIEAVDQAENRLQTVFIDGRFNKQMDDLFDLKAPDSAEVIDLRHES